MRPASPIDLPLVEFAYSARRGTNASGRLRGVGHLVNRRRLTRATLSLSAMVGLTVPGHQIGCLIGFEFLANARYESDGGHDTFHLLRYPFSVVQRHRLRIPYEGCSFFPAFYLVHGITGSDICPSRSIGASSAG